MSIGNVLLGFRGFPRQPIQTPEGASGQMQELIEVLNADRPAFKERDALKAVEEPLRRLKSAPAEERIAFVFEALAVLGTSASISLHVMLKGVISQVLRSGLALNSLHALRMIELASNRSYRFHFPYKALLSSLDDIPMTPALKEALLRLRPIVGETHGMQEIQERIDVLVYGEKEKPVAAVSGWSSHVFQEIDGSAKQLAWRGLLLHARSLTQATATSKWKKEAIACIDNIGRTEFLEAAHRWLALGPMPGMPAQLAGARGRGGLSKRVHLGAGRIERRFGCPRHRRFRAGLFSKNPPDRGSLASCRKCLRECAGRDARLGRRDAD